MATKKIRITETITLHIETQENQTITQMQTEAEIVLRIANLIEKISEPRKARGRPPKIKNRKLTNDEFVKEYEQAKTKEQKEKLAKSQGIKLRGLYNKHYQLTKRRNKQK